MKTLFIVDRKLHVEKLFAVLRYCLIYLEVVRDTTVVSRSSRYSGHDVVSAVSATTRHDRFFYLPTKDLAHKFKKKLFWVSTICAQILGFSRIY